jgi:hypothetical protein
MERGCLAGDVGLRQGGGVAVAAAWSAAGARAGWPDLGRTGRGCPEHVCSLHGCRSAGLVDVWLGAMLEV